MIVSISEKRIGYQVINTRNVDNVSLVLDETDERKAHNTNLCSLLKDKKDYCDYLYSQCRRLAVSQEMPILDGTFHANTLKSSTKRLFKSWIKVLLHKDVNNDFSLRTLLRNDTRKNVLLRSIRKMH